ncbi:MAG: type IV pilus secretin PilQ [Candidatus Omnitrophica bacterium]|nr:type IV pilus secretin PilQ [Candidatus Omnitrophota bacterium]
MLKQSMIAVVTLLYFVTAGYAQSSPDDEGVQTIAPDSVSMTESGNVSFDFRDADIRNVFKILSFKSGVNIVASPEVQGVVTIQLNDVPWKQALDVIVQTYGFAYEQKGNIVVVTTVANMKQRREDQMLLSEQTPLDTKTHIINFGKASEIIESVEKMKSERGSINFDERTNTIIITDTPQQIETMSTVILELDRTTEQVLIEAKIVETNFTDAENLGVDWITQASAGGSQIPITWPFDNDGTSSRFAGEPFPGPDTTEGNANTEFQYGTLNFSQVQAVFELLKTRSDTDILQNPRIVTLDNQPAQIVVGSQYPIPSYTYNEEQARLQVSGWEYKDIGIIFDVTPHVNNAGYITLEVQPKITAILDFVTVENTTLPRLSNESTKTKVMIKDGDTLVIAGLITDQTTETKKKTPILGDIPLLGLIFTKNESSVTKSDLVLFITPHIITPEIAQK